MCNRYRLRATPDAVMAFFNLSHDARLPVITAEYFPGRPVPVVCQPGGVRQLQEMTWGFPPLKGKTPINNTRCESAAASPYWKPHLGQRCVFPLTAAIEWQHQINPQTGELRKVPHLIRFRDDRLAAVAGIYGTGSGSACCSMMTCRANRFWSTIHNAKPDDPRMVCFLLQPEAIDAWLDPNPPYETVRDLLRSVPDEADLLSAQPNSGPPQGAIARNDLFG